MWAQRGQEDAGVCRFKRPVKGGNLALVPCARWEGINLRANRLKSGGGGLLTGQDCSQRVLVTIVSTSVSGRRGSTPTMKLDPHSSVTKFISGVLPIPSMHPRACHSSFLQPKPFTHLEVSESQAD